MSTFASGPGSEPGDHVVRHASIVLPWFNEEEQVLPEVPQAPRMAMYARPVKALMPSALFLIARSRADT